LKALFICDDKEDWNLLRNLFHAHFNKVELICVTSGKDALDIISYQGPISLLLIECALKNEEPTEIARTIFDTAGERALLFIGTEAMLKNRVKQDFFEAHEMVQLYKKPYEPPSFKKAVDASIQWAEDEDFENSIIEIHPDSYVPLKLRNFYLFDKVGFNAYIELSKTKYIKVISKNKPYTESIIQEIKRKNIQYLFLEKDEHLNFLESSLKKINSSLSKKGVPSKVLIQTQIAGALIVHQYLQSIGITDSVIEASLNIVESIPKAYKGYEEKFMDFLEKFPLEHADLAEQSILCAYFCEAITYSLGWRSNMARKKLVLAALIHDAHLADESLSKITHLENSEYKVLCEEERKDYVNHPKKASKMALHFTGFSEVDFIIDQHHERPDAKGFPNGLNSNKITTISSIFILSDNFVRQLTTYGITRVSVLNVLSGLKGVFTHGNFKEPYLHLVKLIKGKFPRRDL
jgi:response regulator RpfG family c-di-GMP phosphodiesterase